MRSAFVKLPQNIILAPGCQSRMPVKSEASKKQYEVNGTHEARREATGWVQATQVPQYSDTKAHCVQVSQHTLFVSSWASEVVVSHYDCPGILGTVRFRSGENFPAAQGCRCSQARASHTFTVKGFGRFRLQSPSRRSLAPPATSLHNMF